MIPMVQEKRVNDFHFSFTVKKRDSKNINNINKLDVFYRLAYVLQDLIFVMLTRRDVLTELKRMGVKKPSLLKDYLRDFEKYVGTYYDFRISKVKTRLNHRPNRDTESSLERTNVSPVTQKTRIIE